jgi:D-beta-D-heptose 7-phosphate kinase/D-beta-D-heptose 1-phosphate adenosyltransferase
MAAVALVQRRSRLDHKVLTRGEAERIAASIRAQGRRLVFTNGCFDLFHPGHFHLLRKARELGDVLVVGINSDASIRRIKGDAAGRPFIDERGRLQMLCPIEYVDYVVVFEEDTPEELIAAMRPDVLAKGANYSVDQVVGASIVRGYGGEVVVMDVAPDYSVTTLSRAIARKVADEV